MSKEKIGEKREKDKGYVYAPYIPFEIVEFDIGDKVILVNSRFKIKRFDSKGNEIIK